MRAARSGSLQPSLLRKFGKGKFWEEANGEGSRRGRIPLPFPRNAAWISPSPAMPRRSARANDVIVFRLLGPFPWRNYQTGRSYRTYPGGALRTVRCDNAKEPRKPNEQKIAPPIPAKGSPRYQKGPSTLAVPEAQTVDARKHAKSTPSNFVFPPAWTKELCGAPRPNSIHKGASGVSDGRNNVVVQPDGQWRRNHKLCCPFYTASVWSPPQPPLDRPSPPMAHCLR
jgi:hypothetical protein